ncbi:hypothetical protein CH263_14040 [Rhodococcus sp. 06-1059B-a]|nr:hypothetical protein [Rhodococcus sp. 06-1059B-a]OZD64675.1 hypothetical protein CH263_14040 [Rhodococcus sp. 06-1059B-a]
MTQAPDTLTDDLGRSLRTSLQVALLAGEAIARRRENRLREARQRSEEHARAFQTRLRAERGSAEAQLRPVHSSRWWDAATPEILADTYRTAHAWKDQSPVAADALARLDDQLAARHKIDTTALGVDQAGVADRLAEVMNERAAREAAANSYAERGFTVVDDRPAGRGFIPTWDLRQANGEDVDRGAIDSAPQHWAVFLTRDDKNEWAPEFFCTDVAAAGLDRPVPPLYLAYEDWWWEMAAEHQIAEIYEQFIHTGAAYGVAHMEDQISRHYGIDAKTFRGLPDELAGRLAAVTAERAATASAEKSTRERSDTVAAIAHADRVDAARETQATPAPGTQLDTRAAEFDAALEWAKATVPRDAERYVYASGERKDAARETITIGWEVVQSKAWATENAPALAAQFAQTEISANRQDYLTARTELIQEWSTAGRPRVDAALGAQPAAASASSASPHRYDSKERRDALAAELTAAGVAPDAVAARIAADRDNAHPIGTPPAVSTSTSPKASKGDRSKTRSVSTERGDR